MDAVPPNTFPSNEGVRIGTAFARWTTKPDGDFSGNGPTGAATDEARRQVADKAWAWVSQVHGNSVVLVTDPQTARLESGDALISNNPDAALAVRTADCGSIAIGSSNGWFGAIHAGWGGLVSGVVEVAIAELRSHGATDLEAGLGPCIHPSSYAFSTGDLDRLSARFGPEVVGKTSDGEPSFDLPRAIAISLHRIGVPLVFNADTCTAENESDYFSHRARQEKERQALVVWNAS